MSRLRTWSADLALGVRLAVGDRHTPWGRLALMTIGIGIGVAVLLVGASLPTWMDGRDSRAVQRDMRSVSSADAHIPAAVLGVNGSTSFHDQSIQGWRLQPQRPDAPRPAGLDRFPAPGELVVSPALGELLAQPESELLRQRLAGHVVGYIDDAGLLAPGELYYYTGATGLTEWNATNRVDQAFGESDDRSDMSQDAWFMWTMGSCVLLLPVVVFVVSTTRLAEAARQRRLAALRLVGAGARQVRRIASGESLVGAVAGVAAGWAMFLAVRAVVEDFEGFGVTVFRTDVTPVWWLAVLITVGVPAMTVLISLTSLRGAVQDPLRWVRQGMPVRRRLWPRCVPLVVGCAGIVLTASSGLGSYFIGYAMVASVTLVLVSVPLLLPWTVDAAARRLHGGPVAWQLALRRLHFTSGTAARSVSAIAVVVTGVIGLQTLVVSLEAEMLENPGSATNDPRIQVSAREDLSGRDGLGASLAEIQALPGVRAATGSHSVTLTLGKDRWHSVAIADCASIARMTQVEDCVDGAVYRTEYGRGGEDSPVDRPLGEGELSEIYGTGTQATGAGTVAWRIPPFRDIGPVTDDLIGDELLLTPAAAVGIPMEMRSVQIEAELEDDAPQDLLESVRNVVAANLHNGSAQPTGLSKADDVAQIDAAKYALLLGALVTFSLIGCSLLVTAIEQIQERTRPMAVLGAVGARRSTLVWSAFLQNAVPMLLTAVLAVPIGLGTGSLLVVTVYQRLPVFDLPGMGAVLSFAAVSVLVVTALTAPALSRAMSSEGLHTE